MQSITAIPRARPTSTAPVGVDLPSTMHPPTGEDSIPAGPAVPAPTAQTVDPEAVAMAAADLADTMQALMYEPHDVVLRYDADHHIPIVEVRDASSGELIRQFPPEEILKMRGHMDELLGTVIDRKS